MCFCFTIFIPTDESSYICVQNKHVIECKQLVLKRKSRNTENALGSQEKKYKPNEDDKELQSKNEESESALTLSNELKSMQAAYDVMQSQLNVSISNNETLSTEMSSKDVEIASLNDTVNEQMSEIISLKNEIMIKQNEATILALETKITELCTTFKNKEKELVYVTTKLEGYESMYRKPISGKVVIDEKQKMIFVNFIDFANSYTSMPQGNSAKEKLANRKIKTIQDYMDNNKNLHNKCKFSIFS